MTGQAPAQLVTAPMMDWSDRHCRYMFRLLAPQALIYTEMVTANAIIHGDRERLLVRDARESPVVLQLGGAEPANLKRAVELARPYAYDQINLNCGCPSKRVQKGTFGAALMAEPKRAADCVKAMQDATEAPVTVKCRIGIDNAPEPGMLHEFLAALDHIGIKHITVHARKAWLDGLSAKQNREIPPLRYAMVHGLKRQFPKLDITINGGIKNPQDAQRHIKAGMQGVMIGRTAYHQPLSLRDFAQTLEPDSPAGLDLGQTLDAMRGYAERQRRHHGTPLIHITRHMLGLAHGLPGARSFRRMLSDDARQPDATPELIARAGETLLLVPKAA